MVCIICMIWMVIENPLLVAGRKVRPSHRRPGHLLQVMLRRVAICSSACMICMSTFWPLATGAAAPGRSHKFACLYDLYDLCNSYGLRHL